MPDTFPTRARIAHVITESNLGGAQRNTLLSVQGLLTAGFEVELICGPGGPLADEARASGATSHLIPRLVRPVHPVSDLQALLAIYRLCRRRRYRIVHTHCTKAGLLGRVAAWLAGVPIIVHTVHGAPFELGPDLRTRIFLALERLAGRVTDRLVCVGETFRRQVAGWGVVSETKLVTIYSGLDFGAYVRRRPVAEMKRVLGLENAWPIIGTVGRLSEAKALDYLLEAVASLRRCYPCARLLLVGDGPLRLALEATAERLGCSDAVHFLGERDDVADLLAVFDVYAMSSRWEGVGRAMTEAMLSGLPVVATDVGGVRELVVDGETGLVTPPRDCTALAAAMDRVVSDRELAVRLGAAARRKVRDLMNADRMVADLRRLYVELRVRAESRKPWPSEERPHQMAASDPGAGDTAAPDKPPTMIGARDGGRPGTARGGNGRLMGWRQ